MSEEEQKFNRGSALSIFGSDRREDLMALLLSLILVFAIYMLN
jgi:hypothetical protein